LTFSKDKSLFSPIEDADAAAHLFSNHPAAMQINTVFNDYTVKSSIIQKKVFEQTFLVKDTTRNIAWKITDETREIAGYTCRRANAIVMDSVYVVAFYSDEIPVSGGPEIFSGLPGMILGVALPHENITWFATSVKDNSVGELKPPAKGKATDNNGLRKTLAAATKQWGEYAQKYLKIFLL
ncbi:MAG: GLPGLI family protein, partial [Pyrinomonadaceae bacterium]|nr:GLPGLI family protein [Sphingobacteriaceae bacterium]